MLLISWFQNKSVLLSNKFVILFINNIQTAGYIIIDAPVAHQLNMLNIKRQFYF